MTKLKKFFPFVVFLVLTFAFFSFASEEGNSYSLKVPEFPNAPKIDGLLENPLWEKGVVLDTFTQYEPQPEPDCSSPDSFCQLDEHPFRF
jgi:hypothetical protein